uniref:Uncharacterized protein n=1 Tax=Glossina palpalis gambiensis TaxID=67801 RepID=A0A1B0C0D9_9MUSC
MAKIENRSPAELFDGRPLGTVSSDLDEELSKTPFVSKNYTRSRIKFGKNTTVSKSNRGLLQNMLSYFLHIMRQKSGGSSFVCVQLLQTLNILFENIRNETLLCRLMLT